MKRKKLTTDNLLEALVYLCVAILVACVAIYLLPFVAIGFLIIWLLGDD